MVGDNFVQLMLQCLLGIVASCAFYIAGSLLLFCAGAKKEEEGSAAAFFFPMFHGMNLSVAVYAVGRCGSHTLSVLVAGGYVAWLVAARLRRKGGQERGGRGWGPIPLGRIALACAFFTLVFRFLPESEYKQDDSFFYLKIAESLNATGQENVHAYNNAVDASFHGVEPYHYTELWLNAALISCTRRLLPGIQTFRIAGYTIISVCLLFGLLGYYEVFAGRRAGLPAALFCLSFLFFIPDLLQYFPAMRHYLVYEMESNSLERPNFRTLYLYLLPLLLGLKRERGAAETSVFVISFAVVSYIYFLVFIPVMIVLCLCAWVFGWESGRRLMRNYGIPAGITAVFFAMFYGFFSNRIAGGYYRSSLSEAAGHVRKSLFFVGSTIVTSMGYLLFIVVLYTFFFFVRDRAGGARFFRENRGLLAGTGVFIVWSIVISRVLSYQDNAYQLAHPAYVLGALAIFAVWAFFAGTRKAEVILTGTRRAKVLLAGTLVFAAGYVLYKWKEGKEARVDIFRQNGNIVYGGSPYSEGYLARVTGFFSGAGDVAGGYLCDSVFYSNLYYSRRNPNVYFPPVSYIIANRIGSNYEYCLSDSTAMFANLDRADPYQADYLSVAIRRSGFYVFQRMGGWQRSEAIRRFIAGRHLRYLILSGRKCEAEVAGIPVAQRFEDPRTGEVFLCLVRN